MERSAIGPSSNGFTLGFDSRSTRDLLEAPSRASDLTCQVGCSHASDISKVQKELSGGDEHNAGASHVQDFRKIIMHIWTCTNGSCCSYPRCSRAKALIEHCRNCNNLDCRVCIGVRNWQHKRKQTAPEISSCDTLYASGSRSVVAPKGLNQVQKRLKMDHVLQSVPTDFEISRKPDVAYNGSRAQQPRISDVTQSIGATKSLNQVQKCLKMDHVLQSVPRDFGISSKLDVAYNGSHAQQPRIYDVTRSVGATKGLNQVQKCLKMDHVLQSVPTDFEISRKPDVAYNGSRAQQPRISDVTQSIGATKSLNQVQKCLKMDHVLQSVPPDFGISSKPDVAYNGSHAQQPRIYDVTRSVGATKGLNQVQKCLKMDHVLQSVPTDFEISRKPDVAYNGSRAQQPRISDVTQSIGATKSLNQVQKCLKMDHVLQSVPPDFGISSKPDVAYNGSHAQQPRIYDVTRSVGATKGLNQVQKCLKMDHVLQSVPTDFEISRKPDVAYNGSRAQQPRISDVTCMEIDTRVSPAKGFLCADNTSIGMSNDGSSKLITADKGIDQDKYVSATLPAENMGATNPKKPEAKVVSLIELFTPDQVREHIGSLKQCVGQSKPKTGKPQAMEQNPCQLCGVAKLNFEPIPIYCTPCGTRIKRNAKYYTTEAVESRQHICNCCYNQTPGDSIVVGGTPCPKARLEKQKNDKFIEEGWVQCDKCHAWQHQICALFNSRCNEGGQAKFTCPCCYIAEVERGECTPLQQSAVPGAKDLPKTSLSDHLEQRLFKKLKQERVNRARVQGKTYDEVPGAECLVVRVVSSVDKKLEVKKQFFETLKELNYPNEFAYKSKVVLLFQKIEGVEVCLFAMIVQEYGANCQQPNHRSVYLSYMDSVKYFRPEIKAVTGEDLRTFVYHEILIGYLEHCKKRGFTSCYIWACPPIKGDDYIFHCHPEMQKTPKSDKLREWYVTMLEKAAKENIVVELTNLYDHFFDSGGSSGECKVKVTAARLPYFDGDYFPGAAEDFIHQLQQEEGGILVNEKTTSKTIAKRALKEYGQADLSGHASKDFLLMHKLGEAISPKKEDFIMVHLQHSCSYCCTLMTSGNFWGCCQCKDFRLCDKCYEAEQKLEKRERHPVNNQRDIHILYPIEVSGVPEDTQDNDEILGSKFFDTRLAFLELCEGNHYQYDTLRRAKHSSMMLLHHLHNPNVPAFEPTTWSGDISPTP